MDPTLEDVAMGGQMPQQEPQMPNPIEMITQFEDVIKQIDVDPNTASQLLALAQQMKTVLGEG